MGDGDNKSVVYKTGSTRSAKVQGVPYWLVPWEGVRVIAQRFHEGRLKYGAQNWKKGQLRSDILDHAIEHLIRYANGDRSENHLGAVGWAVCTIAFFDANNIEIDDTDRLGDKKGVTAEPESMGVIPKELIIDWSKVYPLPEDSDPEITDKNCWVDESVAPLTQEERDEIDANPNAKEEIS